MAQKIERQELLNIFFRSMGATPFQFIEGKNPFRIEYFGKEYYIYIKNLSSAHFSNPDVWRAQLPIREDFSDLAEQDIDFIMFGYDAENEVYTCWNPTWVKQRLNKAESVSLYSRLSLQQEAAKTHQLKRLDLSNDGEVIAFPQEMISVVLMGIQNFFRNTGDYVAMGSKKRTEANESYRLFSDAKNVPLFADYMSKDGKSQSTIGTYCRCIKNLLNDNYITRYRKVFLACDSLEEYSSVVDEFFAFDELKSMNDKSHMQYSAALRAYIEYLTQGESIETGDEELPFDVSTEQVSKETEPASTEASKPTCFDVFCDINTVHTFETYLGRKDYQHSTVRRYARAVEFLLNNGWIDRYKELFTKCNSFAEYNNAADIFFKKQDVYELNEDRHHDYSAGLRQYILYLIAIDEHVIPEQISDEVFGEANIIEEDPTEQPVIEKNIDWEAEYTDANGKLTKIANPELLEKIRPFLDTEYQELPAALTVIAEFYGTRFAGMQLFEWGKLISDIDWTQPFGQHQVHKVTRATPSRKKYILKVEYPDGKVLQYDSVADTYAEVITDFYPELITEIGIEHAGVNIVSREPDAKYEKYQRLVNDGWYIMMNSSTETKMKDIQTISDELELNLIVSLVSIDNGNNEEVPEENTSNFKSSDRNKIRVIFPNGHVIRYPRVLETLIEVVNYAGPEKVRSLNIMCCGENLILKSPNPRYEKPCKPVKDGWFVNTYSNTQTKYEQIKYISKAFNLDLKVDMISGTDGSIVPIDTLEDQDFKGWQKVKITYPGGKESVPNKAFEALVEVVKYAGPERVYNLNLKYLGGTLVCRKPPLAKYEKACKPVGDGWLVNTCSSSARKVQQIEEISDALNLGIKAEIYQL